MICKWPFIKDPDTGKWKGTHRVTQEMRDKLTPYPCGRCLHCRINAARVKTARIMLEARCHQLNSFVTLTYDQTHLPLDNSVHRQHLTKFIKRLRRKIEPHHIRVFGVGEYGENWRPHYHLAIFGWDAMCEFREIHMCTSKRKGQNCPEQIKCEVKKAWTYGIVDVGELNIHSARYIAGYLVKKLNNVKTDKKAKEILNGRLPEFSTHSTRNGGLGIGIVDVIASSIEAKRYHGCIQRNVVREATINGSKLPLGRYLTQKLIERLGNSDQANKELWDYQNKVISEGFNGEASYYVNLIEKNIGARASQEARRELWKRRRPL